MTQDTDSLNQAKAQYEYIKELVDAYNNAQAGESDKEREAIEQSPLSVEVRTDWHEVGADDSKPTHYRILLCTGGPAVQIVGELSEHLEPETAVIQHQDWGTPWTDYRLTSEQEEIVLTYARCFYYGE